MVKHSQPGGCSTDVQGYDISNYEQPDPRYGTLADWEALRDEVHKHGMRLVMDLVINHSSEQVSLLLSVFDHRRTREVCGVVRERAMCVTRGRREGQDRPGGRSGASYGGTGKVLDECLQL